MCWHRCWQAVLTLCSQRGQPASTCASTLASTPIVASTCASTPASTFLEFPFRCARSPRSQLKRSAWCTKVATKTVVAMDTSSDLSSSIKSSDVVVSQCQQHWGEDGQGESETQGRKPFSYVFSQPLRTSQSVGSFADTLGDLNQSVGIKLAPSHEFKDAIVPSVCGY